MEKATSLSIDKATKERAAERARRDKLTVSSVARILLSEYAEGRIEIGARTSEDDVIAEEIAVDAETQALMDKAVKAWREKDSA